MVKINYLNNRDIMTEIHKSKNTYTSYLDDKFSMYDVIITDLKQIDSNFIKETQIARSERLYKETRHELKKNGLSNPTSNKIPANQIPISDLVIRYMTDEHIPVDLIKRDKEIVKKGILTPPHKDICTKTNFPPFQHYMIDDYTLVEDGDECEYKDIKLKIVGKSHWVHGLENGHFSQDHGRITNKLARMYIKLVERIALKSNWRNYCVDDQTQALTQRGWLSIDDITETDTILSYDNGELKWSKIKSIFRGDYNGMMFKLKNKTTDMLITPEHKLVTKRGLIKVDYLLESDNVILIGKPESNMVEKYSNEFVELMGWIFTEGSYEIHQKDTGIYFKCLSISQKHGPKAERIRNCLNLLNYKYSEKMRNDNVIIFRLYRDDALTIYNQFPDKNLSMPFILDLSMAQRDLLLNTMIDGDGWRVGNNLRYTQKDLKHIELIQILGILTGRRSKYHHVNGVSFGKESSYYTLNFFSSRSNQTKGECIDFHGGKMNGKHCIGKGKIHHPNIPTEFYNGRIWCPETEYGSFMARRNGTIYLTGNTYREEMQGQALLQLSQVGLKFNEAKSDNPFAYYTETIKNSFTGVLNSEKKNQNIRDDLLISAGAAPSYSKQLDMEEADRKAMAISELEDSFQASNDSLKPSKRLKKP